MHSILRTTSIIINYLPNLLSRCVDKCKICRILLALIGLAYFIVPFFKNLNIKDEHSLIIIFGGIFIYYIVYQIQTMDKKLSWAVPFFQPLFQTLFQFVIMIGLAYFYTPLHSTNNGIHQYLVVFLSFLISYDMAFSESRDEPTFINWIMVIIGTFMLYFYTYSYLNIFEIVHSPK